MSSISHQLSIGFQIFHDLLLELFWYEVLTYGTQSTFKSFFCQHLCCFPASISAVICLHFSVPVRIARLRRFTGIDVWLLGLFCATIIPTPLFAFGCCLFLPAEVPVPKLKFHDQHRCPRTSIRPNKLIYHLANQSFPTKSWNLAPNRDNLLRENHFLFYKITLVDETHLHAGRHYFLTALNKILRTSRETNFRLIQAFNQS